MAYVVTSGNLLSLVLDMAAKRTIESVSSLAPRVGTLTFTRGDTLKASIKTVTPTGSTTPLYYLVNIPTYEVALTNGLNVVYALASGWEGIGDADDPHQTFNLDVSGVALDFALNQTTGNSIPASFEIHISGFAVGEGSAFPQDQYIIREPAMIFKSGLNPLL